MVPWFFAEAGGGSCADAFAQTSPNSHFAESLTADFAYRDSLPETSMSLTWDVTQSPWGPIPNPYPPPVIPRQFNAVVWARHRVEAVAKKYIGLPYRHLHIPAMGGLDCSNFTSWVYNYGLGIYIRSNVGQQAFEAGRRLADHEALVMGDLLFTWSADSSRINHVVIYLGNGLIIDSSRGREGVQVRPWSASLQRNFAWARRIIE